MPGSVISHSFKFRNCTVIKRKYIRSAPLCPWDIILNEFTRRRENAIEHVLCCHFLKALFQPQKHRFKAKKQPCF